MAISKGLEMFWKIRSWPSGSDSKNDTKILMHLVCFSLGCSLSPRSQQVIEVALRENEWLKYVGREISELVNCAYPTTAVQGFQIIQEGDEAFQSFILEGKEIFPTFIAVGMWSDTVGLDGRSFCPSLEILTVIKP